MADIVRYYFDDYSKYFMRLCGTVVHSAIKSNKKIIVNNIKSMIYEIIFEMGI